jgi:hypothetical protein
MFNLDDPWFHPPQQHKNGTFHLSRIVMDTLYHRQHDATILSKMMSCNFFIELPVLQKPFFHYSKKASNIFMGRFLSQRGQGLFLINKHANWTYKMGRQWVYSTPSKNHS